jgi:hypothetical protein
MRDILSDIVWMARGLGSKKLKMKKAPGSDFFPSFQRKSPMQATMTTVQYGI